MCLFNKALSASNGKRTTPRRRMAFRSLAERKRSMVRSDTRRKAAASFLVRRYLGKLVVIEVSPWLIGAVPVRGRTWLGRARYGRKILQTPKARRQVSLDKICLRASRRGGGELPCSSCVVSRRRVPGS